MIFKSSLFPTILLLFLCTACGDSRQKKSGDTGATTRDTLSAKEQVVDSTLATKEEPEEEPFELNDDNAIPFFFDYEKKNPEKLVRVHTSMGDFDIELFENTPYHRANFIFLTKKKYFNNTLFHRVVKDFVIQGGNSDMPSTNRKRREIGTYLLPPDTDKGHSHARGIVSMPSSDNVDNPHKLASPYEFFIVVQKPGAFHLDGKYTAFGKVISGMEVVDKINQVPIDDGEWPLQNVTIKSVEILD
ncbi:peptidylprolyl isomerase [Robertkochia solimangrovi]|uniref:peptidylprolyl isomerase n=1 Tax=Robertkochia solimangrovi TaxID=2213046 RepID=UPI00117E1BE8|nr:peptidylprolyl isomerase [Robertkochia solimangrovi]TRZ45151.1 peptidylprolyl isomerase [Robertkochia solimangrovi]